MVVGWLVGTDGCKADGEIEAEVVVVKRSVRFTHDEIVARLW